MQRLDSVGFKISTGFGFEKMGFFFLYLFFFFFSPLVNSDITAKLINQMFSGMGFHFSLR